MCNTQMEIGSKVSGPKYNPETNLESGTREYFCPNCDAKFVDEIVDDQKRRLD